MKLSAIHHIAIIGSDYEKARQFYCDLLGFNILRETRREHDIKLDLDGIGYEIELFIKPNAPRRPTYPEAMGLRHLAFKVESVAEMVRHLESRGIPCEAIRIDTITGKAMTFFHDPDGLPLELHE